MSIVSLESKDEKNISSVRNRNKHKDWIAIICTDMSLSEQDIIRIYGHRWDIEVFFKTCKSSLLLGNDIVETMLATVQEEFHITDEQIECFYNKFMSKLPESMQRLLQAN